MSPTQRRANTQRIILSWCDFHRNYSATLAAGECQPIGFLEIPAAELEKLERGAAEVLAQIDPSA